MRRPIKRKRWKSLLYSPLSIILLFFLVILLGKSVWGVYQKSRISGEARKSAERELSDLLSRQKTLSEELEDLKNGVGVEKAFRERYQVAKPGESVIIIVDEKDKKTP
mgnify:CR=1 FL=1